MKKFLFSTTALAVAGAFAFSGDANAAADPIKIGVGGYMASEIGLGSNSGSFESQLDGALTKRDALNTVQDSEIYFTGTSKLDSGVSVSVTIQLEGDLGAGAIDESYMKLTGGFGDLRIGYVHGSNTTLKHIAPYVGMGLDGGASENYISQPANITAAVSTNTASSGDSAKIVYLSPRAGGLMLGASYTPSTTGGNLSPAIGGTAGTETQVYEAVLSFEQTIGTSALKADIAFEHVSGISNNTHSALRGGIHVVAGGFTVGGSLYKRKDLNNQKNNTTNTDELQSYDLGVSYTMGDYKFGVAGTSGTADVGAAVVDEESKWGIGVEYGGLGGGVTLKAAYVNADYSDSGLAAADNNSGHALVGTIKVSF